MTDDLQVAIGNTYRALRKRAAPVDRTGEYAKTHEWQLYVDVPGGWKEDISRVVFTLHETFSPQKYTVTLPVARADTAAPDVFRFATKQTSYGGFTAKIEVHTIRGGRTLLEHDLVLSGQGSKRTWHAVEAGRRRPAPPPPAPLSTNRRFGVEAELTVDGSVDLPDLAGFIAARGGVMCTAPGYTHRVTEGVWKVVPDSSLECLPGMPGCHGLEVVSPPLCGGDGLNKLSNVLRAVDAGIRDRGVRKAVNASAGLHVHVEVDRSDVQGLRKLCAQFVKYEGVMDSMMPPSRRADGNQYCRSNARAVGSLTALDNCRTVHDLAEVMNPGGLRYFKLNLQPLASNRQATVEFRQHSATTNYHKIAAWVRFCVAFVENSMRLVAPRPMKDGTGPARAFELLFEHVIKDRALRDHYHFRIMDLERARAAGAGDESDGGCACGGAGACHC